MKRLISNVLDRLPYVGKRRKEMRDLREQVGELHEQVRNQGPFPAGHYYSPIPNRDDVLESI